MMLKLMEWIITAVQYTLMLLVAPLTLAVCAGLLFCTYLITRQFARRGTELAELSSPGAEWLGA